MRHRAIAAALLCATVTGPLPAVAPDPTDAIAGVSLAVGCGGGFTGRAGRAVEVSGTGAVTLVCPRNFTSGVSPARQWRFGGAPTDPTLVGRLSADLDAAGFDAIPPGRFPGPVPDGISCTLTRVRGTARHSVTIATSPPRDISYLSAKDRAAYKAVRTTIATLQAATNPAAGTTANQCPNSIADPGEVQRRSHVTAICRHRSRSLFIQAQVDEDGTTTLWDWSFHTDQPPSSAWTRPPIPVTFPANPMDGAAALITALDASGFVAANAPAAADLICGLERARLQAGQWSTVRQEWPGLAPPQDASPEVRRTFEAIRRHADTLPDEGTFRLVEDALEPEQSKLEE